ncbi:MAG: DTW domain-containing protein [Deltaproteobacteria bacterium]|nr:DTW domain-containing protein [Deltaproteobacteria bacterium]
MARPTCYRCLRPAVSCVCALVTPVDNCTPVVIVQHPRERRHPFGTVRLLRLGLRNAEVHVASRGAEGQALCPPCAPSGAVLLYPAPTATPLPELREPPSTLVVVDGTWPSSRLLLRRNPWLQALPRVALTPTRPGRYRIRKAPRPGFQLSTIEAVVEALRVLEPDTPGLLGLLAAFDGMIDHQILLRARAGEPGEASRAPTNEASA